MALEEQQVESDCSELSASEIPEEHDAGQTYEEYTRQFQLKIMSQTWSRDSHGLFDFETRQLQRQYISTLKTANLVRATDTCRFEKPETNLRIEYSRKVQLLLEVVK